ncbi:MAG: SMC family ATPase [bacterium]
MIIQSLRARNFKRFREFELDGLPASGLIGIFGDNECGKSTIGEMICYSLFGRTPKAPEGTPSQLFQWGKNESRMELKFRLGGSVHEIVREMSSEGAVHAQLKNLDTGATLAAGADAVEREIEQLLGFGFREFRYSTFIGQNELDIILRSVEDRRIVLNNMLGVGFMERVSRRAAEKRKLRETELVYHRGRVKDKQEILEVYLSRQKDLERVERKRDEIQRELVESIRERERTSSTAALLEDIRRKKEQYEVLDLRIKNRRERLRNIEAEVGGLMREADGVPHLKQQNVEKENLVRELRETRLAVIDAGLERVERWKALERKTAESEEFLRTKENELKESAARLDDIERKEGELARLEKAYEALDYHIQTFLDPQKFRMTCSHLSKDIEVLQSELDKVRTTLRKDYEMALEKESGLASQLDRLRKQLDAAAVDEVNQQEIIQLQASEGVLAQRRDITLAAAGFFVAAGIALPLALSTPLLFLVLTGAVPAAAAALAAQVRLGGVNRRLQATQQKFYAFSITQRGIQELKETQEELESEKMKSERRGEEVSAKLKVLAYLKCGGFGEVEASLEQLKRHEMPETVRTRDLMESLLSTYGSLRDYVGGDPGFERTRALDPEKLLLDRTRERDEAKSKMDALSIEVSRRKEAASRIETLNAEIGSVRNLIAGYRSEQDALGVTEDDERALTVEKKETALRCEQLRREIEDNVRTIARIEQQGARIKDLESKRREIVREIDEDLIKYYEMREATRDIDCSDEKFALLREKLEFLERKVGELTSMLKRADAEREIVEKDLGRAAGARRELLELQSRAKEMEEGIIKFRELETLLMRTGQDIKKRLVPQVESYFGWILPRMTRGRYQKVRLSDDFDIRVFSYEKNDYVNLDSLSGGTVDQLLISLRLAFARAATADSQSHSRFLFLDEPFSSFDESRRELFFNLLRALQNNFQQIFLISHLPDLEEFVDHYLRVDLHAERQPVVCSWR